MLELVDRDTVLVIASSMGQKPFISPLKKGKRIGQPRSLDRLMEILDVKEHVKTLMTMSGQFNVYPDSPQSRETVLNNLKAAYIDEPSRLMFYIDTLDDSFTVNLRHYDETTDDSRCYFPHKGTDVSYRFEDLVYNTGMVKSGCHDEKGIMMLYGSGIKQGGYIEECNNLDIAPTLLTLLGLPVETEMKGRVLREAFAG
jgi:hypothetical protein